ncbi:hypothetical protein [Streptomyces sp. NBC_00273]|uniref:hypothetical protein n=1 Tax=Streptomyces sp. NBC_00273 TaxID=2903644 RepID=UPI002E2A749A|nr:hypothetical protein [Streptomyces sp. NBC_00273]
MEREAEHEGGGAEHHRTDQEPDHSARGPAPGAALADGEPYADQARSGHVEPTAPEVRPPSGRGKVQGCGFGVWSDRRSAGPVDAGPGTTATTYTAAGSGQVL